MPKYSRQHASVVVRRRSRNISSEVPRLVSPISRITGKINVHHKFLAQFLQIDSNDFKNLVYGVKPQLAKQTLGNFLSHNTTIEKP